MRVVLTNFGTTGDLQPFLALAIEMKHHGHQPVLAFSPLFKRRVRSLGLDFLALGPNLLETQNEINAALMNLGHSPSAVRTLLGRLLIALPQVCDELREACASADLLISGPAQPAARIVHELIRIPFVSVQVSHFGGIGSPSLKQASVDLINPYRRQLGLLPLANPLTLDANSPQLALYAVSRHVLPPPSDWPAHYHMTGYFFLDEDAWQPPPALLEFLDAGEPPIVFSFGSMPPGDPDAMIELFLETTRRTRWRAIIQWKSSELSARRFPSNVVAVGYVPHRWLFRRASCIVHHGGGGTAGAVFRSGVPSVFVPHGEIFDQYYWARLAQELGCAAAPINYAELTAERLEAGIRSILTEPAHYSYAAALSHKLAAENGVGVARELIEQLLSTMTFRSTEESRYFDNEMTAEMRATKLVRRKQYQQGQRARRKNRTDACLVL